MIQKRMRRLVNILAVLVTANLVVGVVRLASECPVCNWILLGLALAMLPLLGWLIGLRSLEGRSIPPCDHSDKEGEQ